jgi:hypothetical protein
MVRQKKNNSNETARRMVEQHLLYREQTATMPAPAAAHLDEDQLASFVGGSLKQSESAPLIKHLVACSPCRRATSQLIRLEAELGESEVVQAAQPEPGRIRRLLEGLAARVLPQADEDAVFAYHAPAEDLQQTEQAANATPTEETSDDTATGERND